MPPRLITGLSEIAQGYDALICDIWGVVHNGHVPYPEAAAALRRFRQDQGPVVLLSNAPRSAASVIEQFQAIGVPEDCYDAVVTSGGAARADLAAQSADATLPVFYIGPERDAILLAGLNIRRTGIADAAVAVATGLTDDLTETPENYRDVLAAMRSRNLPFLCANPDLVVHRGPQLCWCAGALARDYEKLGGHVIYYGKPHLPIYELAYKEVGNARRLLATAATEGAAPNKTDSQRVLAPAATEQGAAHQITDGKRMLAIGDGLYTDVKGANAAGLDVLFIADGVHGEDVEPYTPDHMARLYADAGVTVLAATRALKW